MRRLAAIAWCMFGGCTCLFDPTRVRVETCEPLPQGPLDLIAGDRTSITFEWPNPPERPDLKEWELCWGPSATQTDTCKTFAYGSCGDAGRCAFRLDGVDAGLQYNRRLHGRLVTRNLCRDELPQLNASATPVNGDFLDLAGIELSTQCDAGRSVDSGILFFEQMPPGIQNCVSVLAMGDDATIDGTIEVELRSFGNSAAGIGFRNPSGGGDNAPRMAAVLTPSTASVYSFGLTRRFSGAVDAPVATAIPLVQEGVWYSLRTSAKGREVSVAMAPLGAEPGEIMRWKDLGTSEPVPGRFGVALASVLGVPARAELRRLRFHSAVTIPDGGATAAAWSFSGSGSLDNVRILPTGMNNLARVGACPGTFIPAPGCASCAPSPGSQCVELNSGLLTNASATVAMPLGIDVSRPWSVSFKFGPTVLDNPNDGLIIRATSGDWAGKPIVSGTGNNWMNLRGFENDPLGQIGRGEWHSFELTFDAARGRYSVRIDGRPALDGGTIPPTIDAHLGAFIFGGDGAFRGIHGYWTDVSISQP